MHAYHAYFTVDKNCFSRESTEKSAFRIDVNTCILPGSGTH